jgi:hypothetical protein
MLALLRRLSRSREHPVGESAYVRQLISLLCGSPVISYPRLKAAPATHLIEPLTAKELAVLRQLALFSEP